MRDAWKFLYWPAAWALSIYLPYRLAEDTGLHLIGGWPAYAARAAGLAAAIYALTLHAVAGRTLRRMGHSAPGSFWPDRLVTRGIYSCMRHPQHLGLAIMPVALALLLASPAALLASGWGVAAALAFVLLVEEPECLAKYGDEYAAYARRTPAFTLSPRCLARGLRELRGDRS